MLQKLYHHIIDYILPKRCIACANLTQDSGSFCSSCFKNLNFISPPFCACCGREFALNLPDHQKCLSCLKTAPPFNKARFLFKFDEYSKKIIHSFKYYDKTIFAQYFAEMLVARYLHDIKDFDAIVPVPMHRYKRLLRMYNPAQELAGAISKIINLPIYSDILCKTKWTRAQTTLSRKARLDNIRGSIAIKNAHCIKNKKIILVDDVITTGATIGLCAKLLKKAGAKEVVVLSIAAT